MRAYELLPLFGEGGFDRCGDSCDQRHLGGGAKIQDGTHLFSENYLRRLYRLGGTVGCGFHGSGLRPAVTNEQFGARRLTPGEASPFQDRCSGHDRGEVAPLSITMG